ncbi:hypothetical protein MUK42_22651 [Musa troglodytarum]|uniref:Uncharacterized protein n=1 Tax=Musa troglodytarum TaxID=320322 RepID=A0A9E7JIX1_9LILI|nr:hypothetical protein MUK42_22651 [Musa troglodytarum]
MQKSRKDGFLGRLSTPTRPGKAKKRSSSKQKHKGKKRETRVLDLEEDSKEFIGKKGEPLLRSSAELQRTTQPAPRFLESFPKVSDGDLGAPLGSQEAEDGESRGFLAERWGFCNFVCQRSEALAGLQFLVGARSQMAWMANTFRIQRLSWDCISTSPWWGLLYRELNVVMAASLLYTAFTA